ncbi:MAG: PAS domain S-box protein [Candidatus Colwellbacteria bacterium]|nr:PAS domain S-box protein [Candidatus Colwellbacteria bacterium]
MQTKSDCYLYVNESGKISDKERILFKDLFVESLDCVIAKRDKAKEIFKQLFDERRHPLIVIFEQDLAASLELARYFYSLEPDMVYIFLTENKKRKEDMERDFKYAARVGDSWLVIDINSIFDFKNRVLELIQGIKQKRRMRTTIGAVREQIRTDPPLDVPEYRRLLLSSRYFKNVLDNAGEAIFITDLDGRITQWNVSAQKLFGLSEVDVSGKLIFDKAVGEFKDKLLGLFKEAIKNKSTTALEVKTKNRKGEDLIISTALSPVQNGHNRQIGIAFFVNDRTEEVKRREREKAVLKEAEQTEREKKEILASLKIQLEKQVKERTQELQEKINELETMNKLMIGRELKMIKLKEELEKLKNKQSG